MFLPSKVYQFIPIENEITRNSKTNHLGRLMDLELSVFVELGRMQMFVKDILELGPGTVVDLNKCSKEPVDIYAVDIYVNQKKYAEGEVVVVDQNFGVRITALVGPKERFINLK